MALPKQENFSSLSAGANLTTITGWTRSGTVGAIVGKSGAGGLIAPSETNVLSIYYWSGDGAFGADQYAQGVISNANGAIKYIGLALRVTTGGNGYYCIADPGAESYIGYSSANSGTDIRKFTCPASGHTLKLSVSGSTFTLYDNGSILQTQPYAGGSFTNTFTDTTFDGQSTCYAGVASYSADDTPNLDDWEGGNVGGGTETTVTPNPAGMSV